jgi:hypothetical protein
VGKTYPKIRIELKELQWWRWEGARKRGVWPKMFADRWNPFERLCYTMKRGWPEAISPVPAPSASSSQLSDVTRLPSAVHHLIKLNWSDVGTRPAPLSQEAG